MAGDALPGAILKHPHVGKASAMFEGFVLVLALRVIGTGHDSGVVIRNNLYVFVGNQAGLVFGIFQVLQELRLVLDGAIIVGVNECRWKQLAERIGVMMELRLVPGIFKDKNLA